ncbi:MAG: DNA repair protein RecN [Desulfobulbus sp.]|jgi:DNA repair protein RecN (Recombination protein N)|uniref:DNA repair protein RecN n=1 Tax=Desulfobulbus sp. TaxID=895 RepID=UPI00284663F5|nr:DNA repair protein RecN [Desulfobulbus sp.]MDR2548848.1 DNA repair protein RecN [Desulfobulbus sp.]
MLQELRVRNLALIDALHLDLSTYRTGLIVLTGETGAGKSIILQAINLLAGGRGAASWVRNDCDQAGIEAVFALRPDHAEMHALLAEHSLKDGSTCIVRRVLGKDGRSRAYVNDQGITGRLSGELAAGLINIASQHDQQQLLNGRHHLEFLDTFGELHGLRQQFTRLFQRWQQMSSELRQLMEKEQDKEQQRDFLRFQLDEIRKAKPVEGEDENLAREREQLKSADALQRLVGASSRRLAVLAAGDLVEIRKQLEQAAGLDPGLEPLAERLASAGYELDDLAASMQKYREGLSADPLRLDAISERLAELKQLQRKYGPTLAEVLAFAERAEATLALLESLEQEIGQLELRLEEVATEALLKAAELSQGRKEAARKLERNMERELSTLGFSQALFRVALTEPEGMGMVGMQSTGRDVVEFLFSANPGEPPKPLAKIVSGGELSRLMLAMKCLLARRDQVDTVIFDEVDAGIGGQAAEAVAGKIVELSGHHQVLCITHLAQIAACADLHFKVEKKVEAGRTRTVINPLTREERVAELARMLGGDHPTPQTLAFAGELIERKGRKATP